MTSQRMLRLVLLLVLVGAGVGVWYGLFREPPPPVVEPVAKLEVQPDPPPPDPRLTFETPYRNVKPDVKYVGDAACASCHPAIDASYHQHPMGRSAARVGGKGSPENYTSNNPFEAQGFTLRVEKTATGDRHIQSAKTTHGQPLPDHAMLATVAIGSGTRGRSYLAIEDGTVYQTSLSWFGQTMQKWDLSPGFDLERGGRRPIARECLFCHVNSAEYTSGSLNRLASGSFPDQLSIGCERCHGPGELHVQERHDGKVPTGVDTTIVNPRHLARNLQSGICRQCHLQAEERVVRRGRTMNEYRPGLPWELFVTTFVRHPKLADLNRSVGQFEQMHASKCFTASGKMDCVTCHDPHQKPDAGASAAFYRARCASCHEPQVCKAPARDRAAAVDNCVACHMPKSKSTNIAHTAVTDHRVPRRPQPDATSRKPYALDSDPIVAFDPEKQVLAKSEFDRDLAIAFARTTKKLPSTDRLGRSSFHSLAEARLVNALTLWPGDAAAWSQLGMVRGKLPASERRLEAARQAYQLAPDLELALVELAQALVELEHHAEALPVIEMLIERNPRMIDSRILHVSTLMTLEHWAKAEAAASEVLAIQPLHPQTRLFLALCLHKRGDPVAGAAEAETAAHLRSQPQDRADYYRWYAERTLAR